MRAPALASPIVESIAKFANLEATPARAEIQSAMTRLVDLGYTASEAERLFEYSPEFALVASRPRSANRLRTFYRGVMVPPPRYTFDRGGDFTPFLDLAKSYGAGGVFQEANRGEYANLVFEFKLPRALVKARNLQAHKTTWPLKDQRAIISRVGVMLKEPQVPTADAAVVFLPFEEAFDLSLPNPVLRPAVELKKLARLKQAAAERL